MTEGYEDRQRFTIMQNVGMEKKEVKHTILEKKSKERENMQTNDIRKTFIKYAGPKILGLVFNSLYIIVDGIFVAKMLGAQSLAAVSTVVPVFEILVAISLMISIGCGIYISMYK